jgi:hypothetical protein
VKLLWKEGNDYVAMLARPAGEGSAPSHGYGVETDTTDRVHWLKGLGLADFPYLDRRLFVTDGGVRASNELKGGRPVLAVAIARRDDEVR